MNLQGKEFLDNLLSDLETAKSLTIISPYISHDKATFEKIRTAINNSGKLKSLKLVTLPIGYEYCPQSRTLSY